MSIKNVALVGAAGALGTPVFKELSANFNLTVLRRSSSSSTFPEGTKVIDVDFDSVDSLTTALKGQDAVVSTIATTSIDAQKTLIDAAVAAGVSRIIPSEFGCDLDIPVTRKLPVYGQKVAVQDYIIEKAKTSGLTYTFVYNAAFLDWGLEHGFLFNTKDYKPLIIDGGNSAFSATLLSSVATAVVGVLKNPAETKNRAVRIQDIQITQTQLLSFAKKILPEKPWSPQEAKLDDLTTAADERLAKGLYDMETFAPYLFRAILDPAYGSAFDKTDNELLGVKGLTEDELFEVVKQYIK